MGFLTPPIGVDLGDSSLKVVQLRGRKVSLAAIIDLVEVGHDTDALTRQMQQSFSALGLAGKNVVVNIPGTSTFVRTITFPSMPGKELKEAIAWEVKRQLSYPIEQAIYDYVYYKGGEQFEVTFAAVERSFVTEYIAPFADAGLSVAAVDINPLCILRAAKVKGAGNVALIDIGSLHTEVHVVKNGILRLTRTFEVGSAHIKRQLSGYDVSQEEADRLLREATISELSGVLTELTREIFRSIDYYKANFQEAAVNEIILLGGLSLNANVAKHLETTLNTTVRISNPFEGLRLADETMRPLAPLFTVALGLARRKS